MTIKYVARSPINYAARQHKADVVDLNRPFVVIGSPDATVRAKLFDWAEEHWQDNVDIAEAEDGLEVMALAQERTPALVIVATALAERSGLEVAIMLREDRRFAETKIALVAPSADDEADLAQFPHDAVVKQPLRRLDVTERIGTLISPAVPYA